MELSKLMQKLEESLIMGDDVTSLAIAKSPRFALEVEMREGVFVTGLDLAMTWGNAEVCDALLSYGARLDIPVGHPPSAKFVGSTSLTRAVSPQYALTVENHREVIDVIGKHQALRQKNGYSSSIFDELAKQSSKLFMDIDAAIKGALASSSASSIANFSADTMDSYWESNASSLKKKHQVAAEMFETFETIKLCTKALEIVDRNAEPKPHRAARPN